MKPIKYGKIPHGFYEEKHILVETEPVEHESYIFIDFEMKDLEIEVGEESEQTLEEIKAGIEERYQAHLESLQVPTVEERLEETEQLLQATTMAFTEYVFNQMMGK